ncbi:hypothetical protein B0J12DRAFT_640691 [Macrophomina phaseolina]|nr:hypothetical protein B0J12DRAFT_640691 [Macrophomina phaseolina]
MRPPDHAVHDHHTSNSTANAFLGGRRMPSWLTSGQPHTNATPLAPSRKRPPPKDLDQPRRSAKPAPSVAVRNVSNPASPALPNVVASQTAQSSGGSETNILPSPAPSEDLTANRGRAATIVSLGDEEEHEEDDVADTPRVDGAAPAHTRSTSLAVPETSPSIAVPTAIEHASRPPRATVPRPGDPRDLRNEAQSSRTANEQNAATPPADSRRCRSLPPSGASCFASDYLLQELQFLRDISTTAGRRLSAVESVRLDLVRDAASIRDCDYLHFHQLMCLRALSADRLPPELASLEGLLSSLDLLNHLVQTREVSSAWLQWFAEFPVPLETMRQYWPREYDRQILHFRQFVARATGGWEKLQKACFEKRLPPTAVEIEKGLSVSSVLFQTIFSRAIFRRICSFPEPNTPQQMSFFSEAEMAFKEHQSRLQQLRRSHSLTAQRLQHAEINEERRYRDKIILLQQRYQTQFPQQFQPTLQVRRMSRQAQMSQGQQSSLPSNQSHPNPPAQHNPQVTPGQRNLPHVPALQNPVRAHMQQRTTPSHQLAQPQIQIAVPSTNSGNAQITQQFEAVTPASTFPLSHIASTQNINRMVTYQNQQQFQQPVQPIPNLSSPLMAPPTAFNLNARSHSPLAHQWQHGYSGSPMSPPSPSPGTVQFHGHATYPGMTNCIQQGITNGAHTQQMYQRRQSGPIQQQGNQPPIHPQQILRSNSTPSAAPAQMLRPSPSSIDPRQVNGHAGPPVQPQAPQTQPFVPRAGYIWQPQIIDPSQSALHQAHLRTPILKATQGAEVGRKLFQSVAGFALSPIRFANQQAHQSFQFTILPEDKARLPTETPATLGNPCKRQIAEGSKLYRLRCARSNSIVEHEWILQDTHWPSGMFLNLNGQILEIRKKLQHGKDFPVDITRLLKIGENQLEINLLRRPNEEKASNFVIAVEVIEVQHYDRIKDDCCSKRIVLADEVLNSIKSSLNGPGDDDEVAIVDSNVTINLVDPFTNCRPCEVPVRGKYCLHRDCFDLEIFLQTRDRKQPDSPSSVDVWRCPICRGDVRPKSLIVDGFLLEVRKELSMIGQLDTRAIVVDSEGKWKPKPEEKSDDPPTSHSSTPVDNDRTRTTSAPAPHLPSRTPEVIELD